jgi:hypothetical protein
MTEPASISTFAGGSSGARLSDGLKVWASTAVIKASTLTIVAPSTRHNPATTANTTSDVNAFSVLPSAPMVAPQLTQAIAFGLPSGARRISSGIGDPPSQLNRTVLSLRLQYGGGRRLPDVAATDPRASENEIETPNPVK